MPQASNMTTEHEGRKYEFVFGSDVINDGMYVEVWDEERKEMILFAFRSDANDDFTFTAYKEKLPFALVEQFILEAREWLPFTNTKQVSDD